MQCFRRFSWHLKVTQPLLCFWLSQVYIFLNWCNIGQFTSMDFHIILDGFSCLPSGKFTSSSHPGILWKIWHVPRWVKQSPSGYWNRIYIDFSVYLNVTDHFSSKKSIFLLAENTLNKYVTQKFQEVGTYSSVKGLRRWKNLLVKMFPCEKLYYLLKILSLFTNTLFTSRVSN